MPETADTTNQNTTPTEIPSYWPEWLRIAHDERQQIADWVDATDGELCTYCGEDAEHWDHLIPEPMSGPQWRRFVPTVPSCGNCNARLGDHLETSIAQRATRIAELLRAANKDLLESEPLPPMDLCELDGHLRDYVEARQSARGLLVDRLEVLDCGGARQAGAIQPGRQFVPQPVRPRPRPTPTSLEAPDKNEPKRPRRELTHPKFAPPKPKRYEDKHTRRYVWIDNEQDAAVAKLTPGIHRATVIARLFAVLIRAGSVEAVEAAVEN